MVAMQKAAALPRRQMISRRMVMRQRLPSWSRAGGAEAKLMLRGGKFADGMLGGTVRADGQAQRCYYLLRGALMLCSYRYQGTMMWCSCVSCCDRLRRVVFSVGRLAGDASRSHQRVSSIVEDAESE